MLLSLLLELELEESPPLPESPPSESEPPPSLELPLSESLPLPWLSLSESLLLEDPEPLSSELLLELDPDPELEPELELELELELDVSGPVEMVSVIVEPRVAEPVADCHMTLPLGMSLEEE